MYRAEIIALNEDVLRETGLGLHWYAAWNLSSRYNEFVWQQQHNVHTEIYRGVCSCGLVLDAAQTTGRRGVARLRAAKGHLSFSPGGLATKFLAGLSRREGPSNYSVSVMTWICQACGFSQRIRNLASFNDQLQICCESSSVDDFGVRLGELFRDECFNYLDEQGLVDHSEVTAHCQALEKVNARKRPPYSEQGK